ncbi:hypothetical protein HJC04_01855 [Rhizobium sp. NLR8a]|uniref:hypothetical protein n=1 Tax=Rhizobium sp. NLR8a TaxID=2731119 RepID=UPI001C829595|nr:hypothetical protein [Rhizobium sp. NLR8a]MBX5219079.1 hypothetical protein [Rhizobium sp. NLR8a]
MSAPTFASVRGLAMFSLLVCDLTGFDSLDNNILAANLLVLRGEKGAAGDIDQLLRVYELFRAETPPGDVACRCRALREDSTISKTIEQVLYLFYLGAVPVHRHWQRCGWKQYQGALIWRALGVYAPFTRGDCAFGDWARPPQPTEMSVNNEL